jgi:GNAT superfamily N-acetyltransferase
VFEYRQLTGADAPLFDAFLSRHRDSSMFLRSNARVGGFEYAGGIYQAIYVAAIRDGQIAGVAGHYWHGMLVLQAPDAPAELARAAVGLSRRPVTGLCGPAGQVRAARAALGLDDAPAALEGEEWLYGLDLDDLRVPVALSDGAVGWRPPRPDERDMLCDWRAAYDVETLGATDSPAHRQRAAEFLDAQIAAGNAWVAVVDDRPVSLSAFNATLPDIVQLGGIYTPPELRGRGYAKVAVAASLLVAVERGASRAVLFTNNPSAARSYEALGFLQVGDYALILLREQAHVGAP